MGKSAHLINDIGDIMRKLILFIFAIIAITSIWGNAIQSQASARPLHAPDKIKVQLTGEAIRLTNLPTGMYAEAPGFGIADLDKTFHQYNGGKVIRAHRRLKDTAWEQKTGFDRWFLVTVPVLTDIQSALRAFKANKYIQVAIPEYYAYSSFTPNDTYFPNNWGHNNTAQLPVYSGSSHSGAGVGTVGFDANMITAWDGTQGMGNASIVIGIIDCGVDTAHPDLRLVAGYDFGNNDNNPMDDSADPGHGTSCAGVAAGMGNNTIGVAGAAPGCSVMPLKIAANDGTLGFTAIENALTYAADNGVDVGSMSFGAAMFVGDSPSTDTALAYALNAGLVLLAATANDNTSTIQYPSKYPGVIAVGASSPTGQRKSTTSSDGENWWGSNYGVNTQDSNDAVDICAPTILPATDISGTGGYDTSNYYQWFNGTSCATPYAAGVAALILSKDQMLTAAQVWNAMKSSAVDMTLDGGAGWDMYTGYGLVNAQGALAAIVPGTPTCSITSPPNGSLYSIGTALTINVSASDTAPGSIARVDFYLDGSGVPIESDTSAPYSYVWDTTGATSGNHTIEARAVDNESNIASASVVIILYTLPDEGFETNNFSAFPWVQSGNAPWTIQTGNIVTGIYAARSGVLLDNQTSTMAVTLNITAAGNISFYQMVSSEANYDYLRFYIDGVQQDQWSGTGAWTEQSYPVTAGLRTFTWTYSKDQNTVSGLDAAFVDQIDFPTFEVISYYPPQNLTGAVGTGSCTLNWSAPAAGTPTSYKIYRNSAAQAYVTGLTYTDTSVTNGTSYTYYVTAIYDETPTHESAATSTVTLTPSAATTITIGTGTNAATYPFTMSSGYARDATLYLASDFNTTGIIQSIKWYVSTARTTAAPVVVYLKSTTATTMTAGTWANMISGATTVYPSTSTSFTTTGWKTLTLTTPFTYTGGNLLVLTETNYGGLGNTNAPQFYSTVNTNGRHQVWTANTNAPTGNGTIGSRRPNIQVTLGALASNPVFALNTTTLSFGNIYVGMSSTQSFTITNAGSGTLTGDITTPTGYAVAATVGSARSTGNIRNVVSYSLTTGQSRTYNLTFTPTAIQSYNANVTITSNDTSHPSNNLAVTGAGIAPVFNPPTGVTYGAGHAMALLSWTAPTGGAGTLSGYNIYRNGSFLIALPSTQTTLTNTGLTNGTQYAYYITATYTSPTGESAASSTVNVTPIAQPAQNLSGLAGASSAALTWVAPMLGTPASYNVYRNGSFLINVTSLFYTDTPVVNGTPYSYYVTAVYANPTAESDVSNTVVVTPIATQLITIGTGTAYQRQPHGMYYDYERSAALYLSSEIGTTGHITTLGWYVSVAQPATAPVAIRMKSTTSTTMTTSTWANMISGATTVYTGTGLGFPATGWQTITLDTPFSLTTGNLIVFIETNIGAYTNDYPQFAFTSGTTGRHLQWAQDGTAPTGNGAASTNLPNIQIRIGESTPTANYGIDAFNTAFGDVYSGSTATHTLTLTNSGTATLTGNITTPAGFEISAVRTNRVNGGSRNSEPTRNTLPYSVAAGLSQTFNLTFSPTAIQSYNGDLVITSNDAAHLNNTYALTGNGIQLVILPVLNATPASLDYGQVNIDTTTDNTIRVSNAGNGTLTLTNLNIDNAVFALVTPPTLPLDLTEGQFVDLTVRYHPTTVGTHTANLTITDNLTRTAHSVPLSGSAFDLTVTTFPYTQTFDSWPPLNWTFTGGTQSWASYGSTSAYANFWGWQAPNNAVMTTPPMHPNQQMKFQFKWSHHYDVAYPNDGLRISYSTDQTNWTEIWYKAIADLESNDGAGSTNPGSFISEEVILPALLANQTFFIQFDGISGYGPDLYIDDVVISTYALTPVISITPTTLDFGTILAGTTAQQTLTVQNVGSANLTGSLTTPTGYSAALTRANSQRNELSFDLAAGQSAIYNITFAPTLAQSYPGDIVINSNDVNTPLINLPVTGAAYVPPTITVNPAVLHSYLVTGANETQNLTLGNDGSQPLTYTIQVNGGVASGNPAGGLSSQTIATAADRDITGSTLTINPTVYQAETTVNWTISVFNGTLDGEWLKDVALTFPAGVTVNSATAMIGGSGGDLLWNNASGAGATVVWHGETESGWGFIGDYETATASVNVTVSAGVTGIMSLPYTLSGDVYGSAPHVLSSSFDMTEGVTPLVWFGATPLAGTIPAGQTQNITAHFNAYHLAAGVYQAQLLIDSNDTAHPQSTVDVFLHVSNPNTPPTISLPIAFSFNQDGNLVVDFSGYINDADTDPLVITLSDNIHIHADIVSGSVTLTADPGWSGSETVTFTVDDSQATASTTVQVNVYAPLTATIVKTAQTAQLQWNAVTGIATYRIYRSDQPDGVYTLFATSTDNWLTLPDPADRGFFKVTSEYNTTTTRGIK